MLTRRVTLKYYQTRLCKSPSEAPAQPRAKLSLKPLE